MLLEKGSSNANFASIAQGAIRELSHYRLFKFDITLRRVPCDAFHKTSWNSRLGLEISEDFSPHAGGLGHSKPALFENSVCPELIIPVDGK